MTTSPSSSSTTRSAGAGTDDAQGAHTVERRRAAGDQTQQESLIGTDRSRGRSNVSWGAIFAGVVTFLGVTVLLGLASAAMGLDGASATTTGVWTVIFLAIALAAAGYVAGTLAARAGLLHGFLTWATSTIAVIILAGWLGSTLLGALGGAVGSIANAAAGQANVSAEQVQGAAEQAQEQVSPGDVQQAQEQAGQVAGQVADTAATGLWWTFAGTLIGAAIAAAAGYGGARSVTNKRTELTEA